MSAYLVGMRPRNTVNEETQEAMLPAGADEVVVLPRKGQMPRQVSLEWRDGAGELHVYALPPEASETWLS